MLFRSVLLLVGFFLASALSLLSVAAVLPASWFMPEPWNHLPPVPCPWAFAALWLVAVAGIGCALVNLSPRRIAWSLAISAFSFMAYLYLFALPATEIYRTQKPFADAVKQAIGPAMDRLALCRTREIVYYLGTAAPIAELHTPEELRRSIHEQSIRWVIVRRRDWDSMNAQGTIFLAETVHPWEGHEAADTKLLLVQVGGD